jgi:2-(1,2-epoxy-1,2-dihydrophenyl)acetyl-CoA isomerase
VRRWCAGGKALQPTFSTDHGAVEMAEERMSELIRVEPYDGWRKLVLSRPDKLNAVNDAMLAELLAALDAAAADKTCRAIVLTGTGRGFCAGQELGPSVMPGPDGPPDLGKLADTYHHAVVRRIRGLPLPVVCAVNGIAAGAGANFALACDLVLAARSAKFIQAFVRIGLVPDSGGSFFLPRLVGEARARAMTMLGEAIDAERAEALGMIWKCVDDDKLMPEADALAAHLATQPTDALAAMKRAFAASAANDLDAQLDLERDLQREAGRSADFAEGVSAFLAKRAPVFKGRA